MQAKAICLLASQIAKGGPGMVALAGQMLTLVLEDLKLTRNLKMNRVTQILSVPAGSNGPFNLETDYLRTYDMFYPLATPQGMTQFLSPVTMEQYDAEFKATQTANYPYEYATDLSTQAMGITGTTGVTAVNVVTPGYFYTAQPNIVFFGGTGSGAVAVAHMGISIPFFSNPGTGYSLGDIITGASGSFTRPAKLQVTGTSLSAVTSVVMVDSGDYLNYPGVLMSSTSSGAGVGFTFGASEGFISSVGVTSPGAYTVAPSVAPSGGSFAVAATLSATIGSVTPGAGQLYIYPQSNAPLSITHRYMRNQPDITAPETSVVVPWFPLTDYLVHATAARMMGITGDDRFSDFMAKADAMLAPYLIMEGDEQQTVKSIRLDPRRFRAGRSARPTKTLPY